jgi:AraC family transcriptional regulator
VLFFNSHEGYRVSHPVAGGDASLTLIVSEPLLRELAPPGAVLHDGAATAFRQQRLRIDPRTQALVALLRHGLRRNIAESLEAESFALTLVQRALGPRTAHAAGASLGRQLVDRVKLVLASDPARRWTLAEIAAEVRGSPVYLTQVFQQVEGLPLYRYHRRLRLARALDLLGQYDDLTALSVDLGFSSHSHFSAAFREAYGRSPSEFRNSAIRR